MKRVTATYLPVAFLLTLAVSLNGSLAVAQGDLKTVRGTVVDKDEAPLASAIVYLKNTRTLAVRTYFTDGNGTFRFSGLDPNVDYELHAEHGNLTSNSRTISSFDSRKDIVLPLKVDREKKKT